MIRLDDVRVFLEVAAAGSLTDAARALRLPKSTVSRQLARIEQELGCPLLVRTSRSVALTDRGATFLPHARQLLDDAVETEGLVREDGYGAHGRVRVSTPTTFGTMFLAPLLPAFMQRYPRIRVELSLNPQKVRLGPGDDAVDVAVRLGPLIEPDLRVHPLGEIAFSLVAAPMLFTRRAPPQRPGDLTRHDLVALHPRHVADQVALRRDGAVQSVTWAPRLVVDDPQAIRAVVIAGGGIARLPTFLVEGDLAAGALVEVLPGWSCDPTPVRLVCAGKRQPPLRLTAFVEYLLGTIGRDQPWRPSGDGGAGARGA